MKARRKRRIALAAALLVSSISVHSYGAVITYTSKQSKESGPASSYLEEELEETEAFAGPGVTKVSLREQYHADYDIYEESISDLFFIYANVGNGGMTDEAVSIDIPANISYTMEKDGTPFTYTSGQQVAARGTYVLRLTAIENPALPLSEQTEYQAVFRFRIQEKPPRKEAETVHPAAETASSSSFWYSDSYDRQEEEIETEAAEPEAEPETLSSEDLLPEPEETEAAEEPEIPLENQNKAFHSQTYDAGSGVYQVTLENGVRLTTNVPEGYIGPKSVEITVEEDTPETICLYRNDEPVEFVNGNSLMETGIYRLTAGESTYSFQIASHIRDLEYYPAPAGMYFTEVYRNEEALPLSSDRMLVMKEDGSYSIFLKGSEGEDLQISLEKDSIAPEFEVSINGGTAQLQYFSDDIDSICLEKNGTALEAFNSTVVSSPGRYRLIVTDLAGNQTIQEFTLKYQMNLYGIAAILLCILVIGGVAVFVVHTKKNMKIR